MIVVCVRKVTGLELPEGGGRRSLSVRLLHGTASRTTKYRQQHAGVVEFNETLQCAFSGPCTLDLQVVQREHRNLGVVDTVVCDAKVNLDYMLECLYDGDFQLYSGVTHPAGTIHVVLDMEDVVRVELSEAAMRLRASVPQAIPVKRHRNRLVGRVNAWSAGEPALGEQFFTYEVTLQNVSAIFEDYYASYDPSDTSRAKLFENQAANNVVRKEHQFLYNDGDIREATARDADAADTIYNHLRTGSDFVELVGRGIRGGRRRVFTYCLLDRGMFFSETGSTKAQDFTSKHAVHACGEQRVRYAGCFRIVESELGDLAICFDNDSGTYRPNGQQLHRMKELFMLNLPGIDVHAFSPFDDRVTVVPVPSSFLGPFEDVTAHASLRLPSEERLCTYLGSWNWTSGGHVPLNQEGLDQLLKFRGATSTAEPFANELGLFLERFCEHRCASHGRADTRLLWDLARVALHRGPGLHFVMFKSRGTRQSDAPHVHISTIRLVDKYGGVVALDTAIASDIEGDNPFTPHGCASPSCVLEENPALYWADRGKGVLMIRLAMPSSVARMEIQTAPSSPGCDPVSWEVLGSPNGMAWYSLHEAADYPVPLQRGVWAPPLMLNQIAPLPDDWRIQLSGLSQLLAEQPWSDDRVGENPVHVPASKYYIVGTFNSWNQSTTEMEQYETGVYYTTVQISTFWPKVHAFSGRRIVEFYIAPDGDLASRLYGRECLNNGEEWELVRRATSEMDGAGRNWHFAGRVAEEWRILFDARAGRVKVECVKPIDRLSSSVAGFGSRISEVSSHGFQSLVNGGGRRPSAMSFSESG
mmetsp:Transcript_41809/g.110209  ORF Transcript_41809/g.110209 Transcript_41809/m.110209 type:complete len:813 (-) Transcript_41809:14-2452(-)